MSSADGVPVNPTPLVPGVKSSYKNGWRQLKKYFLELFLIGIIYYAIADAIALPMNIIAFPSFMSPSFMSQPEAALSPQMLRVIWALSGLALVYSIFVAYPLASGIQFAYLKAARGDKLEIRDMFEGFRNYWNALLANLLVGFIIVIGISPAFVGLGALIFAGIDENITSPILIGIIIASLTLAIVLGTILTVKLIFTPYLVTDRKMGPVEAVKESWRMTNGHSWQVFFIGLLGIPIVIAGLLLLLVGVVPAYMWVYLALASLYHSVSLSRTTAPPIAADPQGPPQPLT